MYLYGASGHCKVVIEALKSSKNVKIDGVFDDNSNNDLILSIPIIKPIEVGFSDLNNFIITIGNNRIRKKIVQSLKVNYLNAVDSSAIISESAKIDFGTVILAGAIINAEAKIGKHCIINSGAVVEHDCIIEDFVHVSPKAAIAGNVRVCEGANIGIGAVVIQGLTIGKWSTIGAGSVIINDVPDYAVVVGNPGKVIKYNDKNINE